MYVNRGNGTAIASTNAETSYFVGVTGSDQPYIPATFFNGSKVTKAIEIVARGIFSTTGTPTMTFQLRLSTTQGATTLSGTSIGVTKAITTGSGVTNGQFELRAHLNARTPGFGTGNCTLSCTGSVVSGDFASPFVYMVQTSTPPQATSTATIDGALTQWMNFSLTWSASSSSNTSTLLDFYVLGLN